MMKLKVRDMAAERMSLARAPRMNQNIVGTFFNTLEKVSIENNPSDTIGNIFNTMKVA